MNRTIRSIGAAFVGVVTLATTATATTPLPRAPEAARAVLLPGEGPRSGIFRAELRGNGGEIIPALITIEKVDGKLDLMVVVDAPTAVRLTSVSDTELTGNLPTASGLATVALRVTDAGVTGSITQGKHTWSVEGRRTG